METDKKKPDEYPKLSRDDQRWKQQDEFDSAGTQRDLEDNDKNASIEQTANDSNPQDSESNKEDNSKKVQQNSDRSGDPGN
jgi:hypothetical protein